MPFHERNGLPKLILGDMVEIVFHPQLLGELARPTHLVTLALVLLKSDGEGLDAGVFPRKTRG